MNGFRFRLAIMSKSQKYEVSPANFLTIATNVLHKSLLEVPRTTAKNIFKAVSEGRRVPMLDVRMEEDADVRFDIALDHTEYRGDRLNFGAFRSSLTALVGALGDALRNEVDIPVFTEKTDGSMLYGIPGITEENEHGNMLMLSVNLRGPGSVLLKLQYIDPSQFVTQEKKLG